MFEVKSREDFLRLKSAMHLLCELSSGSHDDLNFLRWFIHNRVYIHNYPDAEDDVAEYGKPKLRVINTNKK